MYLNEWMVHCRCGQTTWSGRSATPCARCGRCDLGPGGRDPEPHSMITENVSLETDNGILRGVLTHCVFCKRTAAQLKGQPMVHRPEASEERKK